LLSGADAQLKGQLAGKASLLYGYPGASVKNIHRKSDLAPVAGRKEHEGPFCAYSTVFFGLRPIEKAARAEIGIWSGNFMGLGARRGATDDATIVMKPPPDLSTQEVLAGLIERVTYHNEENGFCVLRIKARSHRELVTVIGHAAVISAGEWITATGEWINDRTHGQLYKAKFLKTSEPTSLDGIEKYLGSGMIRGIGPVYAKKLVRAFGEKVFDTIEAEPERLREVTGIGPVRADRITAAWAEQKIVREIMVFLHSHGVGTARAVRIYKTYGADAVQVMSENPYRLARDIRGIGFKTADAIATKLGIEKTAMIRIRAGISYALTEAMDEGHCGLPTEELGAACREAARGPGGTDPHRPWSGTDRGHGHRRQCRRNTLCVSGRTASGRARHRRPADAACEWHAAALALD
jgi:Holliday junction resolvasome RuvABC DNA-binding subunit